jgi:hypothetical protein
MYDVTSIPLVNRTLATFLRAEFGFFGVVVYTLTHTPLFWGDPFKAGVLVFLTDFFLPYLTSWFIVGITLTAPVLQNLLINSQQQVYIRNLLQARKQSLLTQRHCCVKQKISPNSNLPVIGHPQGRSPLK